MCFCKTLNRILVSSACCDDHHYVPLLFFLSMVVAPKWFSFPNECTPKALIYNLYWWRWLGSLVVCMHALFYY
jgi:dolichyl-phosphate-mannose--protein O-mannosyl transferase